MNDTLPDAGNVAQRKLQGDQQPYLTPAGSSFL